MIHGGNMSRGGSLTPGGLTPARSPNQTNATINPANPANGQANSQKKSQTPGKSFFFLFVFVCLDLAIFD